MLYPLLSMFQPAQEVVPYTDDTQCLVMGLDEKTTDADLVKMFKKYGEVVNTTAHGRYAKVVG